VAGDNRLHAGRARARRRSRAPVWGSRDHAGPGRCSSAAQRAARASSTETA